MKRYSGKKSHNILIVAHQFPPAGGIGVQRVLRFIRDMPDHGWQPMVLTGTGHNYPNKDESLLEGLNGRAKVIRADLPFAFRKLMPKLKSPMPKSKLSIAGRWGYHFWIYDDFYPWIPIALYHGRRILRNIQPDAVFASGNPFCSLIVAHRLARKAGIPLFVDFRDGWHRCPYRRDRGKFPHWLEGRLEKSIIRDCHRAFFVTRGLLDQYKSQYPGYSHKFVWLPNGFEGSRRPALGTANRNGNGKLRVKYVGKFTHYRRPDAFLRGLKRAVEHLNCNHIDVEFVGGSDGRLHCQIQELNLSEYVKVTDFISHSKALESMAQADILLLSVDRTPGYQVIQTGKLFEYMLTQHPILCISPMDSEAAITIRQNNLGKILEPEDESGIAQALATWAGEKKEHGALTASPYELPKTYNHQRIVSELVHHLHDATNELLYERTAA